MSAVLDLASEQQTAARRARMAAAQEARSARVRALSDAKAAIRKYGVRSPEELLALMQCIHAAIEKPTMDSCLRDNAERLLEHCADLESEMDGIAPEMSA